MCILWIIALTLNKHKTTNTFWAPMILQALKIRQRGRSPGPTSEETPVLLGTRAVHKPEWSQGWCRAPGSSWYRQQPRNVQEETNKTLEFSTDPAILMFTDTRWLPSVRGNISQIISGCHSPTIAGMETDMAVCVWTARGDISGPRRMASTGDLETPCPALPIPRQCRTLRTRGQCENPRSHR